jgi:hypothetical protein
LIAGTLSGWAEDLESLKRKEINRSFNVSRSDRLDIDNRYGSITVTYWEKNEVAIRVVVESKANDDRLAQEELDRIEISFSKSGDTVRALTSVRNRTGGGNSQFTVRYFVSMPSRLGATLAQKYGDINMPDNNDGKYNLDVKYGNIHAGNFSQPLDIEAGYSNIALGKAGDLTIDARYCGNISLGDIAKLTIDCKYSNVVVRDVADMSLENSYGNIKAGTVNNLTIETKYGEAKIEGIKETLSIRSLAYGTVSVDKLDDDFKSVSADARYGTLNVKVSRKASFRITAESMKYGSVNVKGLTITDSSNTNKTDYYYRINGGGNRQISFDGNSFGKLNINAL